MDSSVLSMHCVTKCHRQYLMLYRVIVRQICVQIDYGSYSPLKLELLESLRCITILSISILIF